ncbi:helix-turn-helix domain-containing protein [Paraburkholderia bryophila]|jgi:DNA-binding XRE family transcriptional regulator|uniref:Helix-turn-helix protein n=1 Tax=Paraburkholderia bryophila TaxID=420952 RepID=A0A329B7R3_9BURK|nr:helix-turn-helix transcriptional regulator [Paraburkholderia bryophila]RAS17390.1 helix-turn-helix protein [Paraburkholderia bryophila]
MNAPTNIQTIMGPDGKPAFVVIPYADYIAKRANDNDLIPHDVVRRALADDMSPARAWREHLDLTQTEVANRLGVSQSAYAQQETSGRLRKASREKIAAALGIKPAQLDF